MAIVNFMSRSDNAFLIAHCCFYLINLLNVSFIVLFLSYTFEQFQQNLLLKMVCMGCMCELVSCFSSITRYNIDEPYGYYGKIGIVFGGFAYLFLTIPSLHLLALGAIRNRKYLIIGYVFLFLFVTIEIVASLLLWDVNFFFFRQNMKIFKKLKISNGISDKTNGRIKKIIGTKKVQNTLKFRMKPVSFKKVFVFKKKAENFNFFKNSFNHSSASLCWI